MRRFSLFALVAGVLAVTSVSPAARLSAAGSSITGTVKATGLTSNADAVVYVQQAPAGQPPAPTTMDQKKMQFLPHVLPVVVGTTVKFLNSDPTPHNVFSPDNEKYNLGTWPQGQSKDYAFSKCAKFPCVYTQLCRVHPEMEGFVVVLPNPYFAVSDTRGPLRDRERTARPVHRRRLAPEAQGAAEAGDGGGRQASIGRLRPGSLTE